jgi:acetyltransferase-like isoleucine patch superfamily enzyme
LFKRAIDTPWKAHNEFVRILGYPYIRFLFAWKDIAWGKSWKLYGVPIIQKHRGSTIQFGSNLSLRSTVRSNPLGVNHPVVLCTWQSGALLKVGDNFGMTGGSLVAAERISIGKNVIIGANCTVIDTDFHPLDPGVRQETPQAARTAPISIGNEVFIGMNSLILKGVTIGQAAVIGAGSVVTRDVPERVIVAGNPAVIVREL